MKHFRIFLVRSKAYICCLKIETTLNTTYVKGCHKDKMSTNCFKNNIHDFFEPVFVFAHQLFIQVYLFATV